MLLWFSCPTVLCSRKILEKAVSVGGIPASFYLQSHIPGFCALLTLQGVSRTMADLVRLTTGTRLEHRP
ncbi:MAG: hypothetical protein WHT06_05690 [Desulfobacterales bacterium]